MAKDLKTNIVLAGEVDPKLKKAFDTTQKLASKTKQQLDNYGKALKVSGIAVGTAIVTGATYATKAAMEYQTSLAKVATIADTSKKSIQELSKETLSVSNKTGVAAGEVNEALYEAISAGADTAHASELVEVAIKAAKGGFTDAATAVDGLTSVLNTYGMSTQDAEKLANQFLITQNKGKTTFGEIANSIGKVAPIAQSAGIQTDELLSSIAALTANGIATSEAISGTKAAISNIIKPTAEAQKMAAALGLEFNSSALQNKGLSGFMQELKNKTGGNLEIMSKLFGSVEGLNAMLTLTSDSGMALVNDTMLEMQNNTTALQTAYETMANTPAERLERLKNKFNNVAIVIGEKLLPMAEKIMDKIENTDIDAIIDIIIDKINWFMENGNTIAGIAFAIGAGMATWNVISMVSGVIGIMMGWQTATQNMSLAQIILNKVMSMNPIGIVISLIVGLVAGFIYLWNTSEKFRNFWINLWEGIKEVVGKVVGWIGEKLGKIGEFFTGMKDKIAGLLNKIPGVNIPISVSDPDMPNIPNVPDIPAYADGGTVTKPHLALVGDAKETIVPHGNNKRSRSLLAEAAEGVGTPSPFKAFSNAVGNNGGINITYAPTIIGGNPEKNKQVLDDDKEDFEDFIDKYFKDKRRVVFNV